MSATLTLLHPDRIAGGLVLSGYVPIGANLPFRLDEVAGHPIFEAHGIHDNVIPVEWGRRSRDFIAETPAVLTYREYPIGHEISQRELQEVSSWLTGVMDAAGALHQPADTSSQSGT